MAISLKDIQDGLLDFLIENILSEEREATHESLLAELGVDSFALMELLLHLERSHGAPFPLESLTPEAIQSVSSLGEAYFALIADTV